MAKRAGKKLGLIEKDVDSDLEAKLVGARRVAGALAQALNAQEASASRTSRNAPSAQPQESVTPEPPWP
jgi:hypothetical protein